MKSSLYSVLVLLSCTSDVDKVVDTTVVEQETADLDGDGIVGYVWFTNNYQKRTNTTNGVQ